ncbi:hypothetical protein AGMMS50229_03400 [Campylobacterota bacterium]|nr:hypothetical protein AGMMS50229_03400 [Campylobacterota bacterium]
MLLRFGRLTRRFFALSISYSLIVLPAFAAQDTSFSISTSASANVGVITTIIGGDGIPRQQLAIQGEYQGKKGAFVFIKEPNGDINHRFFLPD